MGIPSPAKTSKAVVRAKTSLVWKLIDKDEINNRAIYKFCKAIHAHKKRGGTRTLNRHMKRNHMNWYSNLL
jgi:hypothetical protein